ncbi:hypothetical protein VTJ04DRAFT_1491 [Mycothermus thermophilus]|uniref:uncharacterized protein n=1 Tax=Humicola insolens TaxID=85995 RepID=UPI003743D18D
MPVPSNPFGYTRFFVLMHFAISQYHQQPTLASVTQMPARMGSELETSRAKESPACSMLSFPYQPNPARTVDTRSAQSSPYRRYPFSPIR